MPNTIRIPPALKMPSSVEGVALRFLEKREETLRRASQSWPFGDVAERQVMVIAFKDSDDSCPDPLADPELLPGTSPCDSQCPHTHTLSKGRTLPAV